MSLMNIIKNANIQRPLNWGHLKEYNMENMLDNMTAVISGQTLHNELYRLTEEIKKYAIYIKYIFVKKDGSYKASFNNKITYNYREYWELVAHIRGVLTACKLL